MPLHCGVIPFRERAFLILHMDKLIERDWNQITKSHKGIIPETLEDVTGKLNGLSSLLVASEWYRAAVLSAWIERGTNQYTKVPVENSTSISDFARMGIRGFKSRDTIIHYLAAWKSTGLPKPNLGDEIDLPDIPFPEWGTIISMGGLKSSESIEWYTPAKYLEAAREVMGSIDLDPASSKMANEIVKAPEYITQDDEPDGLNQNWHGNVWLNPPYGKGSGLFTTKLVEEYESGRVNSAILLLNAYGFDTIWFQPLWKYTICFTNHRVEFYSPQRESGGPANANIFIYMGNDAEKFRSVFNEIGYIVRLWK